MTEIMDFITSSMGDGCFAVDGNFVITFFSEPAESISGWSCDDAVGKKCYEVFRELEPYCDAADTDFETGISKISRLELEVEFLYNVKRIVCFKARSFIENGQPCAYFIFNDISKSKEFDQLRKDFMDSMSHELRTPISTIKAYIGTLSHPKACFDKKTIDEFLSIMDGEATKLSKIVDMILEASRITRNGLSLASEFVEVDELVDVSVRSADVSDKYMLSVSGAKNVTVFGDREQLLYVFKHLISNAVKFSPNGGAIEINIDDSLDETVLVSIKDEGMGIPFDQHKRIFEAFFKIDIGTTKKIYSVGMGLFIIKKIIEAHGGCLWFESVLDEGSIFFFSLPKWADAKGSAASAKA